MITGRTIYSIYEEQIQDIAEASIDRRLTDDEMGQVEKLLMSDASDKLYEAVCDVVIKVTHN